MQVDLDKTNRAYFVLNAENRKFIQQYPIGDRDRVLSTYPKCGVSWIQHIIWLIVRHGQLDRGARQSFDNYYIDMVGPKLLDTVRRDDPHGRDVIVIKTHIRSDRLPFHRRRTKYLTVLRNPKDVCLSLYSHIAGLYPRVFRLLEPLGLFRLYFWLWTTFSVVDYFQSALYYWRQRTDPNHTVLIYEDMVRNPRDNIRRIAQYLGDDYLSRLDKQCPDGDRDELLIDRIVRMSAVKEMKQFHGDDIHVRKGVVGTWRDRLTRAQSDTIDRKAELTWFGTELETLWEREMEW
ncbi:sulfotransferase ssu-1-like [Oppia nitens]|uniref:sulfotransferase ssu-1-like n=1 Tax=Oppia nitens TaxID=1686743 RepID=UPI0023DA9AAE|nr:sulfotransferase ssu-1-like [Oppia nitens]